MVYLGCAESRLHYLKNRAKAYNGIALYGYRNQGEDLIPEDVEQKAIDTTMKMYAKSLRVAEITRRLNKQGFKARNGNPWYFSAVKKIIADAPLRDRIKAAIQNTAV